MEDIIDFIEDEESDETINDWNTFVGEKANYYVTRWMYIENGQFSSFNLGAFFLGVFWLLYRKMYLTAFIYMGILFIVVATEAIIIDLFELVEYEKIIERISTIIMATVMGFMGNWLYRNHTNKKIAEIKMKNFSPSSYELALEESGSTSYLGPIISVVIYLIIIFSAHNLGFL